MQAMLRGFVGALDVKVRVAGVVEHGGATRRSARLVSLADGASFRVFQDLGPGAAGCALDAAGVIAACAAVCRDIASGCDLVVLSKFGKLEAESGSGLVPAFAAALEAGVPVLTSLSPRFAPAWETFAAPFHVVLRAEETAIRDWWIGTRAAGRPDVRS